MPSPEDQDQKQTKPRKPRAPKAPKVAPVSPDLLAPPNFPEPGSLASEPEDRALFHEPSQDEVDEQVDQAEQILEGKAPSEIEDPLAFIAKRDEPQEGIDFLDQAMGDLSATVEQHDIEQVLDLILSVVPNHSAFALKAHKRGLHGDFNTLVNAAKHLKKKLNGDYSYIGAGS